MADDRAITFADLPVGTAVTDQYRGNGVVFDSTVFTADDGAASTNPVLSGSPTFFGPIDGHVVSPSGASRTAVSISLDVGYIDSRNSVELIGYDAEGTEVVSVPAQSLGFNHLTLSYRGLASFSVRSVSDEPSGFAVDNVDVRSDAMGIVPTRVASFGDSYSSGEGLTPEDGLRYDCGTDLLRGQYYRDTTMPSTSLGWSSSYDCDTRTGSRARPSNLATRGFSNYQNKCHRHARAYPNQIRQDLGVSGSDGLFIACSGAETKEILTDAQYPMSPVNVAGGKSQIDTALDFADQGDPDLITVGIGGNDAKFADLIKHCIKHDCDRDPGFQEGTLTNINGPVFTKVRETFVELKRDFPGATIAAFGYPSVIGDPDRGCGGFRLGPWTIGPGERAWLKNTVFPALNSTVEDAAAEAGVTFVDISGVTVGHEVCSDQPWINGLRPGQDDTFNPIASESFHPNQKAHDAIADYFAQHLTSNNRLVFTNPPVSGPIRPGLGAPIYLGTVDAGVIESCGAGCSQPGPCVQSCPITIQGSGYAPGSRLHVVLHSTPVDLGDVDVDDTGTFEAVLGLPPGVEAGLHTLELSGTTSDGVAQYGTSFVEVFETRPASRRPQDPVVPEPPVGPGPPAQTPVAVPSECARSGSAAAVAIAQASVASSLAASKTAGRAVRKAAKRLKRADSQQARRRAVKALAKAKKRKRSARAAVVASTATLSQASATSSASSTC